MYLYIYIIHVCVCNYVYIANVCRVGQFTPCLPAIVRMLARVYVRVSARARACVCEGCVCVSLRLNFFRAANHPGDLGAYKFSSDHESEI